MSEPIEPVIDAQVLRARVRDNVAMGGPADRIFVMIRLLANATDRSAQEVYEQAIADSMQVLDEADARGEVYAYPMAYASYIRTDQT